MLPESCADNQFEVANGSPANKSTSVPRKSFSLRTLLLAPILVGTLLLSVFPKLVTGDYASVTIKDIRWNGPNVRIEMDTTLSAGTGIGANITAGGLFNSLTFEGGCEGWIPTWPKKGRTVTCLGLRNEPAKEVDHQSLLAVKVGETHCITPATPLRLIAISNSAGRKGQSTLKISQGLRLGIKL